MALTQGMPAGLRMKSGSTGGSKKELLCKVKLYVGEGNSRENSHEIGRTQMKDLFPSGRHKVMREIKTVQPRIVEQG